jgi:hypothetical protein
VKNTSRKGEEEEEEEETSIPEADSQQYLYHQITEIL